jgi:hypothetical protein
LRHRLFTPPQLILDIGRELGAFDLLPVDELVEHMGRNGHRANPRPRSAGGPSGMCRKVLCLCTHRPPAYHF